jgi:TRAP-type C4-dicarboxylate transport system substrate-binding protein
VTDAWARIERGCLDGIRKDERDVVTELEKSGLKVVQLSAADREQLERRLAPLRDEFRRGTSPAGRALLGAIEKALSQRRRP